MPAGIPPWKKLALKYLLIESNKSFHHGIRGKKEIDKENS
jgi:hypothetical protein